MNAHTIKAKFRLALVCMAALLSAGPAFAAGLLTPSDGSLPALQIRDHQVEVIIEDGYAITAVEQAFYNPHARDLEARYSFPVPARGAVVEFAVWIDGRPVIGEVLERQRAREVYEAEKAAGRDAGITEKDSYRTFETQVSPVRAGQDTRIRMVYLQPAEVDTGIGRYVYPLEEGGVDEAKLAFWTASEQVTGTFSFDVRVRPAYPVDAVRLPNHPSAVITAGADGEWTASLGGDPMNEADWSEPDHGEDADTGAVAGSAINPAVFTLDEDVVVYWRHQAGLPGSVDLVANKPSEDGRGTFMMVVTPGDDLQPIEEGRDWTFVLDVSGSMKGKYATLVDGVERALQKMQFGDRFRIVLFNEAAWELTPGFVAVSQETVSEYGRKLMAVTPGNGTNLHAGLERGLDGLESDRTSALVLVTDGVANVGETRQRRMVELVTKKDIRLFTFVLGNSANRPLLESLAGATGGFAMNISNADDIVGQLLTAASRVSHEALHDVEVEISGVRTADLTPGRPGSLYRGQQLIIFGHYWGSGEAEVRLSGRISGEDVVYQTRFDFPGTATENPEVERLWAYSSIEEAQQLLNDFGEDADLEQAIVDLGVEYGLVTDYTSMVVVHDEVFEQLGIDRNNRSRRALEEAASLQRAGRSAVSRRVDTAQPMYASNRAGHSGSGALDAWTLLLVSPLAWVAWRKRRARGQVR